MRTSETAEGKKKKVKTTDHIGWMRGVTQKICVLESLGADEQDLQLSLNHGVFRRGSENRAEERETERPQGKGQSDGPARTRKIWEMGTGESD